MNRLILLGNGFDLAHGLKTSYNDFILWYLKYSLQECLLKKEYADDILQIKMRPHITQVRIGTLQNVPDLVDYYYEKGIEKLFKNEMLEDMHRGTRYTNPFITNVTSELLTSLLDKCSGSNWVDIENEFYRNLKKVLKLKTDTEKEVQLNALNKSMACLIEKLEAYLKSLPKPKLIRGYESIFSHAIKVTDIHNLPNEEEKLKLLEDEYPKDTLALSFNYTSTLEFYKNLHNDDSEPFKMNTNYIHGIAGAKSKPMIFGFGDELDDTYDIIEKETVKGFFEYIKSFWYFKTSSYRELIRFIDSGPYQVLILGHSCGLSDRTMLHMVFEHRYCRSIKIYYHVDKDGLNNYTELTHEIARHFKDKAEMRNKIVSFDCSSPMPQTDN